MVPSGYRVIESMPVTRNGKKDRRRLEQEEEVEEGRERGVEEGGGRPRSPIEDILAGIWEGVLRLDHVGTNDNFFDIGGHSLLAMQVISRAEAALNVELSLQSLFEAPRLSDFA